MVTRGASTPIFPRGGRASGNTKRIGASTSEDSHEVASSKEKDELLQRLEVERQPLPAFDAPEDPHTVICHCSTPSLRKYREMETKVAEGTPADPQGR